ncbi:MAG: hypothetical protein ACREV6_03885 [Clostridium sp.]|uniref:hypothetical protein n=1 Tax=Clostridium sp. TaxID=1506 RepID=UPI003D6D64D0
MKNIKKIKYIAIVTFCVILDFSLHGITSMISPGPEFSNLSFLAETIGAPGAVLLWMFIAFSYILFVILSYYLSESLAKTMCYKKKQNIKY